MSRRRFFLPLPPEGSRACLRGEEAHHLSRVLRAQVGDSIELINGSGKVWKGEIAKINHESVEVINVDLFLQEQAPLTNIILVQALCKTDKLEWILQKTTELGVAEIFLLNSQRSLVKFARGKIEKKLDRWNKIILGAAKQSRRNTIPTLHPPADCPMICQSLQADLKLLLSENEKEIGLKQLLRRSNWRSVAFCVGPEGGWTTQEQDTFVLRQFEPVTLGSNILRAETAAIAAMAVLKYELENP